MSQRQKRFGLMTRSAQAFALGIALACSSEPLSEPTTGGEAGADGTTGAAGTGGEAGTGSAPEIPDYTTSPCYGTTRTTAVYDGQTHVVSNVSATCRGEGERTLLYVDDSLWQDIVTQAEVNGFLYRFELHGEANSAHPGLGVLFANESVFGALDSSAFTDDKIAIFVIDTRGGGDGYLCSWCDEPELHLDGPNVAPLDGDEALSIAPHESYHAIHRAYDPDEALWVDESLAEAAMTVNGFFTDGPALSSYTGNPNVDWGPAGADVTSFHYGAGLAFGTFLWERGGTDLMRAITSEPQNGFAGLDAALADTGHAESAWDLFLELGAALHFDAPERGYGFESFDLTPKARAETLVPGESFDGHLEPYGFVYYALGTEFAGVSVSGAGGLAGFLLRDGEPIQREPLTLGEELALFGEPAVLMLSARESVTFRLSSR
jgi:hypothetical protein